MISGTSPGATFYRFAMDFERILVPFLVIFGTSGFLLTGTGTWAGVPPSKAPQRVPRGAQEALKGTPNGTLGHP